MTQPTDVEELKSGILKIVDSFNTLIDVTVDKPPEVVPGSSFFIGSDLLKVVYGDITGTMIVIPAIKEFQRTQIDADLVELNAGFFQFACTRLLQMGISVTSDFACYISEHAPAAGISDPYILVSVDLTSVEGDATKKELLRICALAVIETMALWLNHVN